MTEYAPVVGTIQLSDAIMRGPLGLFHKHDLMYQVQMLRSLFLFSKMLPVFSPSQVDQSLLTL